MRLPRTFRPRGVALIIVMIVIIILATLAGRGPGWMLPRKSSAPG